MTSTITMFKNIKETDTPFYRDVTVALDRIKNGSTKDIIKRIRQCKDKSVMITL